MVKNKRLEKEQITTASIKKLISVLQSEAINYEQYQQELQMQLDKMSEANKAYLSQYGTHRKVVLELLRFVLQSENFGKYNKEEYLHNLIYSSLPKCLSNFPYFTGFPACALAKRYVFSLIFALMR